jgi:DNA mismatch endonuclease, patch repair protein
MTRWPTTPERSAIMRAIKGRGTKPEIQFAAALTAAGMEFEEQGQGLPGTPDFIFWDERVAVFVDGDFWHGRIWLETGKAPVRNREAWVAKFERNIERDRQVDDRLRAIGWTPLRVWESDVTKDAGTAAGLVKAVVAARCYGG